MTAIISKDGEFLFSISANEETVSLNTPKHCLTVDDPPNQNMYYDNGWYLIPSPPSLFHIFDYTLKQWIDRRTLNEIKAQKWSEIKSKRDYLEFSGFEFEGNIYDSDQISQIRIMNAAIAGIDQAWTLANNETIDLVASQLTQLYKRLQFHIANAHERGRIARQLIYEAETREQVDAVSL